MYLHTMFSEVEGDVYPNSRYDQTTACFNFLMDGKETVYESGRTWAIKLQFEGGVYDFYSGYADQVNGSGFPLLLPITDACHLTLCGVDKKETGDETVFRLHGDLSKMQWLSMRGCEEITFRDIRIEYADSDIFCPIANPHLPPIFEVTAPHRLDSETILFTDCNKVTFENVKLMGKGVTLTFKNCENVTLKNIAGDGEIYLEDCKGFAAASALNCKTVAAQVEQNESLTLLPQCEQIGNATLCEAYIAPEGGDTYVRPIKSIKVTDIISGETVEIES